MGTRGYFRESARRAGSQVRDSDGGDPLPFSADEVEFEVSMQEALGSSLKELDIEKVDKAIAVMADVLEGCRRRARAAQIKQETLRVVRNGWHRKAQLCEQRRGLLMGLRKQLELLNRL